MPIRSLLAVTAIIAVCSSVYAADPEAIRQADELEKRWGDYYLKYNDAKEVARLNIVVETARKTINPDGHFRDLKYEPLITSRDGGKEGWGPHLIRTADMFTAWRLPGTKAYHDPAFARQCIAALDVYVAAPYDHNDPWGFGHPYADLLESNRIGRCCLFARTDLNTFSQQQIDHWSARIIHQSFKPSEDRAKQFTEINKGWEGGANVLWAVRGELVTYLTSADQDLRIRAADGYFKHVWNSMAVRSPKGPEGQCERLTLDGMLGEHEKPCMGSYGEWYLNDVVAYRDLMKGIKRWEMPPELNKLWIDVLLDSVTYCYQGAVDPNLGNPLIWVNARTGSNSKLREWLNSFKGYDYRDAEIQAVLDWEPGKTLWPLPAQSVKRYYTIDFMTKHFPHWMASIRAVSERTGGMETFGQKDARNAIQSVLLPLGTCFVRRDTREYQDTTGPIFTAMDYARLPGQTTRHVSGEALAACWNRDSAGFAVRSVFGNTPYANGVETAHTGVMGWWQSRLVNVDPNRTPGERRLSDVSVDGRRATFFLEDAVVHLGAAFDTRHDSLPTFTNLEQRLSSRSETIYGTGTSEVRRLAVGQSVKDAAITWAWHDGLGYLPPSSGDKVLQDILQDGDAQKNIATSTRQVFSFYADHGHKDEHLSFDWAVVPDITPEALAKLAANPPWKVLSNTGSLQAIEVRGGQWIGAVFHEAGALKTSGLSLAISRPAVLIIEKAGDTLTLSASDPFERPGSLIVTVDGSPITLLMPGGDLRGSTVKATLHLQAGAWR